MPQRTHNSSPPDALVKPPAPNPLLHPMTGATLRVADIVASPPYDSIAITNALSESDDPDNHTSIATLPQPDDPATVSIYGYLPLACFRNGLDMCTICTSLAFGPDFHLQPLTALTLGLEPPSPK